MYLTQATPFHEIPAYYQQTFHHPFVLTVSKHEILKMRHEKKLTDRDQAIAEYLFHFPFATPEQMLRLLDETCTVGALKSRMERLVRYHVLNRFTLSPDEESRAGEDALVCYCLDFGGKYLLSNYSNLDLTDWFSTNNLKGSELIAKDLITLNFYLSLRDSVGPSRLVYFKASHELALGRKMICPSFECCLVNGDVRRSYVGEIVLKDDLPFNFRQQSEKYNTLLGSKHWMKHFLDEDQAPTLLIVAEDDRLARDAGSTLSRVTYLDRYRLTTLERMTQPLSNRGAFLRYLPDENQLAEVSASAFAPDPSV